MDLEIMASVQEHIIGNCLCVLGDAMAMPIGSMIAKFRDEFEEHIERRAHAPWAERRGAPPTPRSPPRERSPKSPRPSSATAARATRLPAHTRARPAPSGEVPAMPRPEPKTHHLHDRRPRGAGARELDARRRRQARRRRDPRLLLRAQARPAGRRLPHVPGRDRGHPEAADRLLDAGQGRHGRLHADRARQDRPAVGGRVPADQPPARLPGVRQGRRVPAAGHHLRLGRRHLALHRAQAPLRQAARALAADRDRPRALHPLLPLRALLPGGRRGLPAGARSSAAPTPTSRPSTGTLMWRPSAATSSSCARSARSPRAPTASARAPGTSRARARCARCARRSATSRSPCATSACCACSQRDNVEVDDGWLCDKGRFAYQSFHADERVTEPLLRDGGQLRPVSWERALEEAATGLRRAGASTRRARRRAEHQRGGLPARPPDARGSRLAAHRLAPRRHAAAGAAARAGRARAAGDASPTSSSPTPCSCSTPSPSTMRRSSTCACARASAAGGLKLAVASPHASTLDPSAALSIRFKAGGGAAFAAALSAAP